MMNRPSIRWTLSFVVLMVVAMGLSGCFSMKDGQLSIGNTDGAITMTTTPRGATIFLDGKQTKYGTPSTLEVKAGKHTVQYKMDGYADSPIFEVTVPQKETVKLEDYAMVSGFGRADLQTNPAGADIYIDGVKAGFVTPAEVDLPVGPHRINFRLNEYVDTPNLLVNVPSASSTLLKYDMKSIYGKLAIESNPAGAKILIDGEDSGYVTPLELGLTAGAHTLKLVRAGVESPVMGVNVPNDETATIGYSFNGDEGLVSFVTNPPGAEVYVDGVKKDFVTPMMMNLPVGKHRVAFVKPGYRNSAAKEISVLASTTVPVTETLSFDSMALTLGVSLVDPASAGIYQVTPTISGTALAISDMVSIDYYFISEPNQGPVKFATIASQPFRCMVDSVRMPSNTGMYAVADDGYGNTIQSPVVVIPKAAP